MVRSICTSRVFAAAGLLGLLGVPEPLVAAIAPVRAEGPIEEIIVRGRAGALYRVDETRSGKLPIDPLLSTQTIQVINAQLIEDQGARSALDLYRNLSGVSFFSYAGVTARGFRQEENFFDGLRGDPYAGFSIPQLFNVERVEYLKGPAGMLYGPGAPGGLFNYITKRPEPEYAARLAATAGTEERVGVSGEVTGAVANRWSGRLGGFYEAQDLPRRNADSEVSIFDAGLSHGFADGTIVLQATRYAQDLGGNRLRGVPVDATGRFLASRRWNHNEASDFLRLDANVLQASMDWAPTAELDLDAAVRWSDGTEKQQYHEPFGLFDASGDGVVDSSRRQFRDQIRDSENLSFAANLVWSRELFGIAQRTLLGADWFRQDASFDGRSVSGGMVATPGRPTPLALIDPVYGQTDVASYVLPAFSRSRSRQDRAGGYLLNEATWGRLVSVLGGRVDRFEDQDRIAGDGFDDTAMTWRAGLLYRLRDDVSVFAHWAESFEPQSIDSQDVRAGGPFDPTAGTIIEAGVRTALFEGRLQSSASLYRIERTNILQADPRGDVAGDGIDDLIALGEVTSEGAELDLTTDITPNWVATVAYGYNDAKITRTAGTSSITNSVGDRFANAPRHQFGFWTRYQFPALNLAVAVGGDYVSARRSLSNQRVRPYTVYDASLIYETVDWRVLLRVDNLFDRTYAASGFIGRTGHFPGEPRSAFVEIVRRW